MQTIQLWDQTVSFALQNIHTPFLNAIMIAATFIGEKGIFWLVCGGAMCIPRRYRKYGIMVILAVALTYLVSNLILKPIVARPRPCTLFPDVPLITERLAADDFSFPSGHTIASFAAATVIMFANWKFGIPAMFIAGVIGFSRIYLFHHFLSDVLAGAVLGVACAFLAMLLFKLAMLLLRAIFGGKGGKHYDLS